ncbi:MAG: hypothetical protein IH600_15745 [Bacteroidetes bacterium]|nr:hypothetical protein [Bacteroidota bacterium]
MSAAPVYRFPFGSPLKKVAQKDRSPKKDFVLGVYASAVHALWKDAAGKVLVKALAVSSEPEIFWTGEGAEKIIKRITLPEGTGMLAPAAEQFNGPSGIALDEKILRPLGLERKDVWLCDCVPWSLKNPAQEKAIGTHYKPLFERGLVPEANIPSSAEHKGISDKRRAEILRELESSGAGRLILLGDLPIKWFLNAYTKDFTSLDAFVMKHGYGKSVKFTINGRSYDVLPLAHPRQIAKLGRSSVKWFEMHGGWMESMVSKEK